MALDSCGSTQSWPYMVMALYSYGPISLWLYTVMAIYSYGSIQLWPYMVMVLYCCSALSHVFIETIEIPKMAERFLFSPASIRSPSQVSHNHLPSAQVRRKHPTSIRFPRKYLKSICFPNKCLAASQEQMTNLKVTPKMAGHHRLDWKDTAKNGGAP